MIYKQGDIVLIYFPFTSLVKSKKRPVLLIKSENTYGDFVCFQITSKKTQSSICPIDQKFFTEGNLPLASYIKYDKCFTLHSSLVDKKLASVNHELLTNVKTFFCNTL